MLFPDYSENSIFIFTYFFTSTQRKMLWDFTVLQINRLLGISIIS